MSLDLFGSLGGELRPRPAATAGATATKSVLYRILDPVKQALVWHNENRFRWRFLDRAGGWERMLE